MPISAGLDLGHHRDRAHRGVDAALRFGLGDPLDPVRARLVLEQGGRLPSFDLGDDLLEAAGFALGGRQHLVLEAVGLAPAGVHPQQVAGEDAGFLAAGAGADFQEAVLAVVGILGLQLEQQLLLGGREGGGRGLDLLGRHLLELLVREQLLGLAQGLLGAQPPVVQLHRRRELAVLLVQLLEAAAVPRDLRVRQQRADLLQPLLGLRQPRADLGVDAAASHRRRPGGTSR